MSEDPEDNEVLDLTAEMASEGPAAAPHAHGGQARVSGPPASPFSLLVQPGEMPAHEPRGPSTPPEAPAERAGSLPVPVPIHSPIAVIARPIQKLGGPDKAAERTRGKAISEDATPATEEAAPEASAEDEAVLDLGAEYVVPEAAPPVAGPAEPAAAPPPEEEEVLELHAESMIEAEPEPQAETPGDAPPPAEAVAPPQVPPAAAPAPEDEAIVELGEARVLAAPAEDRPSPAAPEAGHPFDFGTPEMVFDEIQPPVTPEEGAEEDATPESEEIDLAEAEDLTSPAPARSEAAKVTAEIAQSQGGGEKVRRRRRRPREWWTRIFDDDFVLLAPEKTKRELRREIDFVEQALGLGPGSLVLDLACGTGGQAVALAKRNYRVVGVDLSLSMLARAGEAAQEAGQKINFIHGDMRDLGFDRTFDGVYCVGTSFGYFDEETNRKVLEGVFRALRPGGSFLLEVVNRDYVIGKQPNLTWFQGRDAVCMEETNFNYINSRLYVSRQLILGGGARQSKHDYSLRVYSLHEVGLLLHSTGFTVNHVSGNLATPGAFFGSDSPRLIIRAERPA